MPSICDHQGTWTGGPQGARSGRRLAQRGALMAERFRHWYRQVASIARKSSSIVHLAESRSFLEGKPHQLKETTK
jgi:hypothetical protein